MEIVENPGILKHFQVISKILKRLWLSSILKNILKVR
jgi:hypothetical protein